MSEIRRVPEYLATWPCGCAFAWGMLRTTAEVAEFYREAAKVEKSSGVRVTVRELPPGSDLKKIPWAWRAENPCTACPPRKKPRAKRTPKAKEQA